MKAYNRVSNTVDTQYTMLIASLAHFLTASSKDCTISLKPQILRKQTLD